MPRAVPVTYADFLKLEAGLEAMRFVEISRHEIATIFVAHGLEPPQKIVLRGEVGFKYTENGYTVKVWTSCLREMVERCRAAPLISLAEVVSSPPGEDVGWIVVVDPYNHAQYFARPTLRTMGFVQTLLQRIWITQRKVINRPLCEKCQKFMGIFEKDDGGTFWACLRKVLHADGKPFWRDWDHKLPPRALRIAKAWRRQFQRYLKRKRANGHEPRRARSIRKGWAATRDPY